MRTLTLHTADELAARWKRQAAELSERGALRALRGGHNDRLMSDLDNQQAQTLRCCASELQALVAVSMEIEAAHAGDPEPVTEAPDLMERLMDSLRVAGDPEPRRGAYNIAVPEGECGHYWADEGGEWMCHREAGHRGDHSSHRQASTAIQSCGDPTCSICGDPDEVAAATALLEWSQGRRP